MSRQGKVTGKVLSGQSREIIFNVFKFFTNEKSKGRPVIPLENVLERAVAASGVSLKTVRNIVTQSKTIDNNELGIESPVEKKIKLEPKTETIKHEDNTDQNFSESLFQVLNTSEIIDTVKHEPLFVVKEEPNELNTAIEEMFIKQELIDDAFNEEIEDKPRVFINEDRS